jgi:hypothetical protein
MTNGEQPPPELVLGRYRVGPRIAAGAVGTVTAAVDIQTGRDVVVKFFDGADDNFSAWVREVRLVMRLRHPNIPVCLNAGHDAGWGVSVLVFERALGGSLRRALASGRRFDRAAARRVLTDVAAALAYSHTQGVVHRDIKPENILAQGRLGEPPWLLADFGAGRFLAPGATLPVPAGSLHYMAPEVMLGASAATSDQFSLGMVGLELLTGELPDRRARSAARLRSIDAGGLDGALARLLDPDPARRFPAIEAAAAALADQDRALDVTATREGDQFALIGADVLVRGRDAEALTHVAHVTGARGFINVIGEDVAVLAAADRTVALSPYARTVGPAAPPRTCMLDVAARTFWTIDGRDLWARPFDGPGLRTDAELPPAWSAGGRPFGVQLGPGRVALGVRGSEVLVLAGRGPHGVWARTIKAPGRLHDLRRVRGCAVALFGDEDLAIAARSSAPTDCRACACATSRSTACAPRRSATPSR